MLNIVFKSMILLNMYEQSFSSIQESKILMLMKKLLTRSFGKETKIVFKSNHGNQD